MHSKQKSKISRLTGLVNTPATIFVLGQNEKTASPDNTRSRAKWC
jgi:hypothetical protein